jgi:hypothetical protein
VGHEQDHRNPVARLQLGPDRDDAGRYVEGKASNMPRRMVVNGCPMVPDELQAMIARPPSAKRL